MSLNGMLKVFSITWIIWIYIFLVHYTVDAKIGYFWHITDLHLDLAYSTKGDVQKSCWHIEHRQTNSASSPPGRFGDYQCDSPWSLIESATQAMKSRQGDNVEFVLWTGDGLAHSTRRLIESHRLDVLRNITDLLRRTFPSQFVFPVLGHEDGQGNSFRRLGELWRHWLPSEALQTFEKGGYYTIDQTKSRLRIIALNTNYMRHDIKYSQTHSQPVRQRPGSMDSSEYTNSHYHHNNHYRSSSSGISSSNSGGTNNNNNNNGGGTVSALSGGESHESQKQWEWLEDVLAKSSRNKETVYIVGHIPPGSDERQVGSPMNSHTAFSEKNNLRYLRLVRKYSTIILGQFFGHLHSDSFRIIYNDIGKPVSWIMIAPSVTPRKTNVGSNNPAMRLYKFDTDTGQVLDYTQYYLDLAAANSLGEAVWQPEYNLTTQYFGSGEVTAVALHNLADRFPNTENSLFSKYYRANGVRHITEPCENVCALNHYCAITRVDYREFRQCLETAASALASSSPSQPNRRDIITSTLLHLTVLLSLYNALRCNQRKLLSDWFNFIYHLFGIMLAQEIANHFRRRWFMCISIVGNFMIHCGDTIWQQFNFPIILSATATVGIDSHHNSSSSSSSRSSSSSSSWTIVMLILQKMIFNCVYAFVDVVSMHWRRIISKYFSVVGGTDDGGGGNICNRDRSGRIERIVRNESSNIIEEDKMCQIKFIKCQSKLNKLGRSMMTMTTATTETKPTTKIVTSTNCNRINSSDSICNVVVQFCDDYHIEQLRHVITLSTKTTTDTKLTLNNSDVVFS